MQSSLAFGIVGVIATYFSMEAKTKYWDKYLPQVDDALDVFCCHAVAGTVGTLLTGCFASKDANPAGADGLFFGGPILLAYQSTFLVSNSIRKLLTVCFF
jgi:ammonium transporter, Amt family